MSYLSPEVVQEVIQNPDLLKLGGKRMEITAYFSDVQGFTSISEQLSPEQIVALLNDYLTAMSDIILKYGGTVDKYEGDAIVAFFGAPIPHADHAKRCCNRRRRDAEDSRRIAGEMVKEGYPNILARMGLNSGPAIIGNMGSQQRMNYTMMGDTVNSRRVSRARTRLTGPTR
jgi:adenylate cyclase